jgi:hypothetical protein
MWLFLYRHTIHTWPSSLNWRQSAFEVQNWISENLILGSWSSCTIFSEQPFHFLWISEVLGSVYGYRSSTWPAGEVKAPVGNQQASVALHWKQVITLTSPPFACFGMESQLSNNSTHSLVLGPGGKDYEISDLWFFFFRNINSYFLWWPFVEKLKK